MIYTKLSAIPISIQIHNYQITYIYAFPHHWHHMSTLFNLPPLASYEPGAKNGKKMPFFIFFWGGILISHKMITKSKK